MYHVESKARFCLKKQFYLDLALMCWTLVLILVLLTLLGCKPEQAGQDCTSQALSLPLRNGKTLELPAVGKVVMESHYVTNQDPYKKTYPKTVTENIDYHLAESCKALGKTDCSEVYNTKWARQWTPSEHGEIGQGSRGFHKLDTTSEVWAANMNLKKNFAPNTRLLAHFGGRSVVLSIGHEIGPSTQHIMGMSPEAHWYLGTDNETFVEVEFPVNQTLPFGPIRCK